MRRATVLLMSMILATAPSRCPAEIRPLLNAHAHNDYEHSHPLSDAMACGFTSVEADIHFIRGQLLVAHSRREAEIEVGSTTRTLQTLYLDPLKKLAAEHHGRIYADAPVFYLYIDIKSDPPEPTIAALRDLLARHYADLLTHWTRENVRTPGAVTVIITGNHTHAMLTAFDGPRYFASDGTPADLEVPDLSPELVPLIGVQWSNAFRWRARGAKDSLPPAERTRLHELVEKAHAQQRQIRFWAAPDNPMAWKELMDAGVDLINTDDLKGFASFSVAKTK